MRVVVTGASSGLGKEIANRLINLGHTVASVDIHHGWGHDVSKMSGSLFMDLVGSKSTVDALINCAGINTNEWFEEVTRDSFDKLMSTNAWGIVHMSQLALPYMERSHVKCIINIVSNASHIPMTSSLAYNASKAAAAMITKQMAHELTPKYGVTVFSVSPNKLHGTGMSRQIEENVQRVRGWSEEYAKEYQKKALMHGRETDPVDLGEFIADLLDNGHFKYMSGCDIQYGK